MFFIPNGWQICRALRRVTPSFLREARSIENLQQQRNPKDELVRFRRCLFFMALDQSTPLHAIFSHILFLLLTFVIPLFTTIASSCNTCDEEHQHPFDDLVLYSEISLAVTSFLCITYLLRAYGLRKVLLLDKIHLESEEVQRGYGKKRDNALFLVAIIILPCLIAKIVHEIWWYCYAELDTRLIRNGAISKAVMCFVAIMAWTYRTSVFILMCVLFRLMCSLQILQLQYYLKLLGKTSDVPVMLTEYMRIHKQLSIISHRCRLFVVLSLLIISINQFVSIFMITAFPGTINFFRAGGLLICSIVQLTGLYLCLSGAARITHRAHGIISVVSKWHAIATCSTHAAVHFLQKNKDPVPFCAANIGPADPLLRHDSTDELECYLKLSEEEHVDNDSYQKREALVTYIQHNYAGISLYGFVLDRALIYGIFGLELSFILSILGKTVGLN